MTSRDPERSNRDPDTFEPQYLKIKKAKIRKGDIIQQHIDT